MTIDKLYLEVTRDCTLECEHCLRGEKQKQEMNTTTLENALKDINQINTLLLTGGEPFLNITVLEKLPEILDRYEIDVRDLAIITNGTVYSKRHEKALKRLKESCESLRIIVSADMFHRLEWNRLNIGKRVEENFELLKEQFKATKDLENDSFHRVILNLQGRAQKLSPEKLDLYKRRYYIEYVFKEPFEVTYSKEQDTILGKVCVNASGYVVDYNKSFQTADDEASVEENVNVVPLPIIIDGKIEKQKQNIKE